MNKCPRCENDNLKEDYNYCPICGVNLGTAPEVPVQEQSNKLIITIGDEVILEKALNKNFI